MRFYRKAGNAGDVLDQLVGVPAHHAKLLALVLFQQARPSRFHV